jgi:hypothetical protein
MRFSEAQVSHLAHKAIDAIRKSGLSLAHDRVSLAEVKKTLSRRLDKESGLHEKVARKIASLGRGVPEGSPEFEVLYRQYYEEELRRTRR